VPLATPRSVWHAAWPTIVAGVVVMVLLLFGTWLDTDPDEWTRALGSMLVAAITAGLTWCAGWALLSKIFTRRSHFWWHVRVLLVGVLAIDVASAMSRLLAFSLSWPSLSDFTFVPLYAIVATMLYFHVKGIEPRRPQRLRAVAVGIFAVATALSLWFNRQNRDQLGEELYMSHLFPPALRLSRPIDTESFARDLASLQPTLDDKARKRDTGGDEAGDEE
jgi:hypothetical protein